MPNSVSKGFGTAFETMGLLTEIAFHHRLETCDQYRKSKQKRIVLVNAPALPKATSPTQDSSEEVQGIGQQMMAVSLGGGATSDTRLAEPGSLQARQQLTLPKRDQPEKSVRLMQEKGMLRVYD